ncbi:unnamed protein product [Rotaria socialis]|uniref:Uncharacterized protein n=2 Tax=Rotaria socialis TaxID=392032 RepID=A0A817YMC0_9BILA|nr:unnamed protein product [Rotaria socialis]
MDDSTNQSALTTRLEKLRQDYPTLKPIYVLPTVDDHVDGQLKERLAQAKMNHTEQRITIILYNLGNSHWIGLKMEFKKNEEIERAEFIDPVKNSNFNPEKFRNQFTEIFPDTNLRSRPVQHLVDRIGSGLAMIENLVKMVFPTELPQIERSEIINDFSRFIVDQQSNDTPVEKIKPIEPSALTDDYEELEMKLTSNLKEHGFRNVVNIPANAKWTQNGVTVAGGNGEGSATNQLEWPFGLFVDDDQTVVIADRGNHRIMQWRNGDTTNGQVVAGGKREGNGSHQLYAPTDVLIDKETDSLIICDWRNRRVVRWSHRRGTTQGEILIDNIDCWGLAMDEQRYLYVSDWEKHAVRRYQLGEKNGIRVAGGNGKGDGLNQLNVPTYLFVDRDHSVYVSDWNNSRVMKWVEGAKEGIVVAGGQGYGSALTQLSFPNGIFVDTLGTLYVADEGNHRVMRWTQGDKKEGTVVVGGNGQGEGANQFSYPYGLSSDRHGNLYVVDRDNHRVQRFSIK